MMVLTQYDLELYLILDFDLGFSRSNFDRNCMEIFFILHMNQWHSGVIVLRIFVRLVTELGHT